MEAMRILFATSEVYPLIKTGGLADVSHSLPLALQEAGHDVRIVLPYYRAIKEQALNVKRRFEGTVFGYTGTVAIDEVELSEDDPVTVWLVDAPDLFDRKGGPYTDNYNHAWEDSAYRFAIFSRVVAMIGNDQLGLNWRPDLVHCNDWQTGLVIPLLQLEADAPATVFTIHNLAYQGNFSRDEFDYLLLPEEWWAIDGLEFYGECSFLKAGVNYADWITTVSPTYAEEIKTADFGEGFDGLMRHREENLQGILNGVDYRHWDPQNDVHIVAPFSANELALKARNKKALQTKMGLTVRKNIPVFGMVCRMAYQKGVDIVLEALPDLLALNIQVVVLGSGDIYYEEAFKKLQAKHPHNLSVTIAYDDALAHQIEAGADFFLMPSRYEPCGLNQIYSLRYGTLPIVRNTGGLADTVVHASPEAIKSKNATGFIFENASSEDFISAIEHALIVYLDKDSTNQMRQQAMVEDFSWKKSCKEYERIYRLAVQSREAAVIENSVVC